MALEQNFEVKVYGGIQKVFTHNSKELKCKMKFAIYLPPKAVEERVPVLYYLSGLTCSEQNVITKSGIQAFAAKHGICVVCPDTGPRGCNIEGETDNWDFGLAASFYVDATEEKWATNYRMYSYITKELPSLIESNFNVTAKKSITGHSMGGHGALICFLKNPKMYQSVSAFAPICNPMVVPWGEKAFSGYLGNDKEQWKQYDTCELLKGYNGPKPLILVNQGTDDGFLEKQLKPENLMEACTKSNYPLSMCMDKGYDHSYYFISTFMEQHVAHHAKYLKM